MITKGSIVTLIPPNKIPQQVFSVIEAELIESTIFEYYTQIEQLISDTYLTHHQGQTINPDSYFLRYRDNPSKRIIALPAHIYGNTNTSGIKWIASNPQNIERGLQRASAVLILNDGQTGIPFACLESSIISATRTVVSALVALRHLVKNNKQAKSVGIIGAGYIAKRLIEAMNKLDWQVGQINIYDLNEQDAQKLTEFSQTKCQFNTQCSASLQDVVTQSEVLITATNAGQPYINDLTWFNHNPIVLNISLRDFSEEIILNSNNIMDDIQHCLKAETSPHLAAIKFGNEDFINGHIGQLIQKNLILSKDKPVIFSPFGLGVLDIALGYFIYGKTNSDPRRHDLKNFFGSLSR